MASNHWLVKQEPEEYSWGDLVRDGRTAWTGIRNFQARNFLRGMQPGDEVLFYHSGDEKQVVGLARVERAAYPDPTATDGDWSSVDLAPVKRLKKPVTLSQIKGDAQLKELPLLRQSRLSVMPVGRAEYKHILDLGNAKA